MKYPFTLFFIILFLISACNIASDDDDHQSNDDLNQIDDDQSTDDDTQSDDDDNDVDDDDNDSSDDDTFIPDDDDNDDSVQEDWIITLLDEGYSAGTPIVKTLDGEKVFVFYWRGTGYSDQYVVKYSDSGTWFTEDISPLENWKYLVYGSTQMDGNETFFIPVYDADRDLYLRTGTIFDWTEDFVYSEIGNKIASPVVAKRGEKVGFSYIREMNDWDVLAYLEKDNDEWNISETGIGCDIIYQPNLTYSTNGQIYISYGCDFTYDYGPFNINNAYYENDSWQTYSIEDLGSWGTEQLYKIDAEADEYNHVVYSGYNANFDEIGYHVVLDGADILEKEELTVTEGKDLLYADLELGNNGDIHVCGEGIYGYYHPGDGWKYEKVVEHDSEHTVTCSVAVGADDSVHLAWNYAKYPPQAYTDKIYYAVKRKN